jgi:hypothetical protein
MTGINRETVRVMLVKDLERRQVCARFVPHFLTPDQKLERAESSVEVVEMTDNERKVLKSISTDDESWYFIHVRSRSKTPQCNLVESKETDGSESENSKIAGDKKC